LNRNTNKSRKYFDTFNNQLFGFNSISSSFDFKKKIKNLKMFRNNRNLGKKYEEVIQY